MKKILLVSFLALLFSGCFPTTEITLRTEPVVEDDEFEKNATIKGVEKPIEGSKYKNYLLRSWVSKDSGKVTNQLYVSYNYTSSDWRFYRNAKDENADVLDFIEIDRDVNCSGSMYSSQCTYFETFGITIPTEKLRDNKEGYRVKISAKSGDDLIISITSDQIRKQLEAIRSYKQAHNL